MSEFDPTVENNAQAALDDAAIQPETPETGEALETIAEEVPQETAPAAKEPGWIKQRVAKEVEKARRAWEAEQTEKLRPLYESMYDRQAEDLVRQGEFKSLDRAKEYVRLKGGVFTGPSDDAAQPEKEEGPKRDAQGRFTSNAQQPATDQDPALKARADLLYKQAQKISAKGTDVMKAFNEDEGIRQKVASGEWDFYDVAEHIQSGKHVPTPVRSPNGAQTGGLSIASMSDAQFARLQQNLSNGKRYDARK